MKMQSGFAAFVAAMILGAIGASETRAAEQPTRFVVRYDDLDLSRTRDVGVLYRRVSAAARRVCIAFDGRGLANRAKFDNCRLIAINKAIADIGSHALRDHHEAQLLRGSQRVAARH